jgi:hypothetical protein
MPQVRVRWCADRGDRCCRVQPRWRALGGVGKRCNHIAATGKPKWRGGGGKTR